MEFCTQEMMRAKCMRRPHMSVGLGMEHWLSIVERSTWNLIFAEKKLHSQASGYIVSMNVRRARSPLPVSPVFATAEISLCLSKSTCGSRYFLTRRAHKHTHERDRPPPTRPSSSTFSTLYIFIQQLLQFT